MSATIHHSSAERTKGRPVHPAIVATEGLVEALANLDCTCERCDAMARALIQLAAAQQREALRLREKIRPEILEGYRAAECLVTAKIPAHVITAYQRHAR